MIKLFIFHFKEILEEGEKNFWDKYEHKFLTTMLKEKDLKLYYKLKINEDRTKRRNLEEKRLWKLEQEELKKNFDALMRVRPFFFFI